MNSFVRLSFGAIAALAVIVVTCTVAALNWVGKNASSIKAGVGTLLLVVLVLAVTAAAGVLGRALWQGRRPAAAPEPQVPLAAEAEALPLAPVMQPAAIEAPRVYLNVTPEQLAAIMQASPARTEGE